MANPSNGISPKHAALSRRKSWKSAPCTIPNIDCGESPRAARLRAAQRCVISSAARAVASSAVEAMQ